MLLEAELARISKQLLVHDRNEAKARLGKKNVTSADLLRTPTQRRHDAHAIMVQRSNGADADAAMVAPIAHIRASHACVRAALQQVSGIEPDPVPLGEFECEFDDGTALTYRQLVSHLIDATIHSVVLTQDGEIMHYGRGRRWFTSHQKQALAYRDRHCECGCGLLARHVDADHRIAWDDQGLTDIENARPSCRTTHTRKTATENHRRRSRRREQQQNVRARHVASPPSGQPPPPIYGTRSDPSSEHEQQHCPLDAHHGREPPTPLSRVVVHIDYGNRYQPGEQRYKP